MVRVPNVLKLRPAEAFKLLRKVGLQPVVIGMPTVKSDGNIGYRVAAQEPAPDLDVNDGARVALALEPHWLSWGTIDPPARAPSGTPVPHLIGLELEDAMLRATRAGLIAVAVQPKKPVEVLAISRQQPETGESVGQFGEVVVWLD
jgi:beta-lactam-binding protein with PASTA domain